MTPGPTSLLRGEHRKMSKADIGRLSTVQISVGHNNFYLAELEDTFPYVERDNLVWLRHRCRNGASILQNLYPQCWFKLCRALQSTQRLCTCG
ncbi:hypothetical protein J6590_007050 [Homalodisca vitripennis]|nr:hypothetical protein J6590_007050 [Homalodisca vitripennis]